VASREMIFIPILMATLLLIQVFIRRHIRHKLTFAYSPNKIAKKNNYMTNPFNNDIFNFLL
jgi:hypothetical protein